MSRQALVVDPDPARRARLRQALEGTHLQVEEAEGPSDARRRFRARQPDLLLADAGDDGGDARALQALAHAPPSIALVPDDRPAARLAALRGGFDEALGRAVPPRLLLARIRASLRNRDALDAALRDAGEPAQVPGLQEARAPWGHAPGAPGTASGSAFGPTLGPTLGPAAGPRVALLAPGGASLHPSLAALARLPGCEAAAMAPDALGGADGADLVAVDASAVAGDLAGGSGVLALLADLRARPGTRDAATLLLLPPSAVETAALALDLGADAVVPVPCPPEEAVHRARALLARKSLSDRLRLHVQARLLAATRDPLTGLHNRRHAEPALRRLAEDARRTGAGLAVLMLDIDHFKAVNDRWGHAAGDRVLREVARRLRLTLGPEPLLARVGGEEFLAAIPGIGAADARALAEGLRRAVEDRPFAMAPAASGPWAASPPLPPAEARVTLSVGLARAEGGCAHDLLERADAALFAAKRAGRNTVSVALGAA